MAKPTHKFRQFDMSLTLPDKQAFIGVLRKRWPQICVWQMVEFEKSFRVFGIDDFDFDSGEEIIVSFQWPKKRTDGTPPIPSEVCSLRDYEGRRPEIVIECKDIESVELRSLYKTLNQKPIDWDGRIFFNYERLLGTYLADDAEQKKFVNSVFYYAKNFCSDWYQRFDLETGEKIDGPKRSITYTGPDSIRLGLEDPNFYPLIFWDQELFTWVGYKAIEQPT